MLPENASIMAFGAHAADYSFRAGGTLLKYLRRGARVKAFCTTFGERCESRTRWTQDATVETVKAIRRKEATQAAETLGVEAEFLDWDDNPLIIGHDRLMILVDKISEFQPDIILTHWINESTYPDHMNIGRAVVHASLLYVGLYGGSLVKHRREGCSPYPRIFLWEPDLFAQPILDFSPDTYVDITETAAQKFDAVGAHEGSQPGLLERWQSRGLMRGMEARGLGGMLKCQYAEAFKRYQPFAGDHFV